MRELYEVVIPHARFGVVVDSGGFVAEAAPIANWTIGKPWAQVRHYYEVRGTVTQLDDLGPYIPETRE